MLDHVFGPELSRALIDAGYRAPAANMHLWDRPPIRITFDAIPSRHNFILMLPQAETERLLAAHAERLGVVVERGAELTAVRQTAAGVVATLGGSEAPCDYLAGCDGAHSAVRHALGLEFAGGAYSGEFALADVELAWPFAHGEVRAFVSRRGVLACFPMRPERRYRVVAFRRGDSDGATFGLDELRRLAAAVGPAGLAIEAAFQIGRFRIHHRMARRFRVGRVFLAGDAAHIHSPVGGQGMNTGIQDALVLAHGLASGDLDAYEKHRMPIARDVLRGTDLFFRIALLPAPLGMLAGLLAPPLARRLSKRIVRAMSEVDVARKEIAGLPGSRAGGYTSPNGDPGAR